MKRPKHKHTTRLGAVKYQELTVITKPVPYAISPIVLGIFHEDIPRTTIPLQQHAEPEEAVTLAVSAQIALGLNRTTQSRKPGASTVGSCRNKSGTTGIRSLQLPVSCRTIIVGQEKYHLGARL